MIPFYHPCNIIVNGPSMAGKTVLCEKLIKNHETMFEPKLEEIVFHYGEWQPFYDRLKGTVTFKEGLPDMNDYNGSKRTLIVIDDLMDQNKSGLIGSIFTKFTHHRNLSVLYLTQNLYHKSRDSREISLNAHYLILFKQPRDKFQISVLSRQMNPSNPKFLLESYLNATEPAHSYLLLDFKQNCPENLRVRTKIFPDETLEIYVPKNR